MPAGEGCRRRASDRALHPAHVGRRRYFARRGPHRHRRGAGAALPVTELDSLRSEEHTSELHTNAHLVCRLLLEKKQQERYTQTNTVKPTKYTHNTPIQYDTT